MNSDIRRTVEDYLLNEAGMSPDKLDEFIREASEYIRKLLISLDDAIDEADFEVIIDSAVGLKVSLRDLGLEELSTVARKLEDAASGSSPAHLACYCMRLLRELRPLLEK